MAPARPVLAIRRVPGVSAWRSSGCPAPGGRGHAVQWRAGEFRKGRLRLLDGEFIDIHLPRFMVRAIWPKTERSPAPQDADYSTPYLNLLHAAIAEFAITKERQPKKDNLVEWFRAQKVEDEPISRRT